MKAELQVSKEHYFKDYDIKDELIIGTRKFIIFCTQIRDLLVSDK